MARTRPKSNPKQFNLYLLGTFHLDDCSRPSLTRRLALPTRKLESLLAYLALHPGPQPREKLAALFWGNAPDLRARNSLRNAFSILRAKAHPRLLLVDRSSAGINPRFPLWIDALVFKPQAEHFLAAPCPDFDAVDLSLYHGDLLHDFDDVWIAPLRAEWRTLYLNTVLRFVQEARTLGDYARAIQLAQLVLARDRTNERAHQHLMFAYLVSGRRQEAMEQYETCRRALQSELDVEPLPETTALYEWIKHAASPSQSLRAHLTNLPIPISSFIGRQREMKELKSRISSSRFVTITGAGGSGKTRLAIQTATDLLDAFKDGVRWVELASLASASLVPQAIAKVFGIRDASDQEIGERLAHTIGDRQLLLVLDNCEHLLAACAAIAERLLSNCPHLKILATSRERLGVTDEVTWLIPLFAIPDEQAAPACLRENEGVQLFAERARAVKADMVITEQNAPVIAQICKRLDGIPLAIELAAARVVALSLDEIAARLDNRFGLLTAASRTARPRQQTLRATIDWSYDLLSPDERVLFRRFAVFTGGATVEAVRAVCGGDPIAPDTIPSLLSRVLSKSLMYTEEKDGETRYRFLDTIQQYACDKLNGSNEAERLRAKHLAFFLKLTQEAEPQLQGPDQVTWFNRLEEDYGNLRAALDWSLGTPDRAEAGLRLAGNLYWFWVVRGPLGDGRRWLEQALVQDSAQARTAARAKALDGLGEIAWNQNDLETAHAAFQQALGIWQELNDSWHSAFGVLCIAWVVFHAGDLDRARTLFEQAVVLARAVGDKSLVARSLRGLGNITMGSDWAAGQPLLEESAMLFRQIGDRLRLAHTLNALANIALYEQDYARAITVATESVTLLREAVDRVSLPAPLGALGEGLLGQGKYESARETFAEGLELAQQNGDHLMMAAHLTGFGGIALARREFTTAAKLFAAAEALLAATSLPIVILHRHNVVYARHLQDLEHRLGEPAFSRAWAEGRTLTLEQAIALAMDT